eukprot:SM000222S07004  [mRNA]  locus=s222:219305:220375:- [translate_table: standard]
MALTSAAAAAAEADAVVTAGPQLASFDWQVKYAVSSSKVAALGEPLLRLELRLEGAAPPAGVDGSQADVSAAGAAAHKVIVSELNAEELDQVIRQLEAASQARPGMRHPQANACAVNTATSSWLANHDSCGTKSQGSGMLELGKRLE